MKTPVLIISVLLLPSATACLGGDPHPIELPNVTPVPPLPGPDAALPGPDAAPLTPEPTPEPEPVDAGVDASDAPPPPIDAMPPDAAPVVEVPPDAGPAPDAPPPMGPCEWHVDSHEMVQYGQEFLIGQTLPGGGYDNDGVVDLAGGGTMGRTPMEGYVYPAFADHWGFAPCGTEGFDYWHYSSPQYPEEQWNEWCASTSLWFNTHPDAFQVTVFMSGEGPIVMDVSVDDGAPQRVTTGHTPTAPNYLPLVLGDAARVELAPVVYPWGSITQWKVRGMKWRTPGPVNGQCPVLHYDWKPERPHPEFCQGCDAP